MKELLTTIIEGLVTDKTAVSITETTSDKNIVFEVKVAESDMGKVIGKEGRIAKAIRTVMKSMAAEEGKHISIEFIG
ncbi:MAG: KH domain-containing protein [Firmicutes bacterium]|nr:KH domain-containing protein [Bacillota bacterium]